MKKAIQLSFLLALPAGLTGCAMSGYWTDRGRDAVDILAMAGGTGGGLTARVGPLHTGLFHGEDHVGFRGGQFRLAGPRSYCGTFDPLIIFYMEWQGFMFYNDDFYGWGDGNLLELRGKSYRAEGQFPFFALPELKPSQGPIAKKYPLYYLTQTEIAVGLGGTVRLGVNPGELLDFILGWTIIDIFSDDAEARSESKQGLKAADGSAS